MKSDLHIHPLGDKYSDNIWIDDLSKVVLDGEDKRRIRDVIDWCCHDRGLDTIALTDHDTQSGLYAMEYVKQAALPIKIIPGAECTVCNPEAPPGKDEVHLLCLGMNELPAYKVGRTSVPKMIRLVHELGGFVIMAHPIDYPHSFYKFCHLLDGYEYRNGHRRPFDEGKQYVDNRVFSIRAFCNSDFHYDGGEFPAVNSSKLQCNYYENDALKG